MKTRSLIIRLTVLLLLLVGIHAAYAYIKAGALSQIRAPATALEDLPFQLGDWVGGDKLDDDTIAVDTAVGADFSIRRTYRDPGEESTVSLYVAVWQKYVGYFKVPHRPESCYPLNGYEIVDTSEVRLECRHGPQAQARLIHAVLEESGESVLYWYQLDQNTIFNASQMARARFEYLGQKHWPPLVKVMLVSRNPNREDARRQLVDFGEHVFRWTSTKL
ncbi:MAG: exosortase-associated EpsI family protein [Pirellulaceae bacterium]